MAKQKSIVTKSPHFEIIMKKYEEVGMAMSAQDFHKQYISKIEPAISVRVWQNFVKKFNQQVQIKAQELIDRIANKKVETAQMEDNSLRKLLAIADVTLDEVVKDPKILTAIPVSERMRWLFDAMKARDSRMTTLTKVQTEKRKTNMYEDMLEGAQYGAIDAEEASDGMKPIIEPKRAPAKPQVVKTIHSEPIPEPVKQKTGGTVEFSPDDL